MNNKIWYKFYENGIIWNALKVIENLKSNFKNGFKN
jgi:hypothetical protein